MGLTEKIRRAPFVVAISSFCRSQLFMCGSAMRTGTRSASIVHCGLKSRIYWMSPPGPRPARPPRLVCVGRLCEAKGQLLLIEAAALLAERNVDFELVLAGDGPLRPELEALIDSTAARALRAHHRLDQQQRRSARSCWRRGRMVLPSFAEGLPVVIMEAMALRRPVLSDLRRRHSGAGRRTVRPAGCFPRGRWRTLAQAMEQCLRCPQEELERMGEAAHRRVVSLHSIDEEARKLAALFRAK